MSGTFGRIFGSPLGGGPKYQARVAPLTEPRRDWTDSVTAPARMLNRAIFHGGPAALDATARLLDASSHALIDAVVEGAVSLGLDRESAERLGRDLRAMPEAFVGAAALRRKKGNRTYLGNKRNHVRDWKEARDLWDDLGQSDILSEANRRAIDQGKSPRVDEAWIRYFPEHAEDAGTKLQIHHIGGLPFVVALPRRHHLDAHMPGGTRWNPGGGPGSVVSNRGPRPRKP